MMSALDSGHMKTLIFVAVLCLNSLLLASNSLSQSLTDQSLIEHGKTAFMNRCSGCHGELADGNGSAAKMLSPKPRNLVQGSFKFRTTPSGILPTVNDLLKTIEQGVIGTSMPSFKDLPSSEKLALVAYIRSLRPEFNETKADQLSLPFGMPPKEIFGNKAGLLAAAKKGREHYNKACVSCHGASGKGDGPASPDLTDSDNNPIRPADFTKNFIKSGKTAQDIFRALSTGLDGSPMPGFADLFKENERWELTAYIFYLRGRGAGIYNEDDLGTIR